MCSTKGPTGSATLCFFCVKAYGEAKIVVWRLGGDGGVSFHTEWLGEVGVQVIQEEQSATQQVWNKGLQRVWYLVPDRLAGWQQQRYRTGWQQRSPKHLVQDTLVLCIG